MPNVVGVDMGCGITLVKLKQRRAEFQKLDRVIRDQIPSGTQIRKKPHPMGLMADLEGLRCFRHINEGKPGSASEPWEEETILLKLTGTKRESSTRRSIPAAGGWEKR